MKKIKLIGALVLSFAFSIAGIKALVLTEDKTLTEDLNEVIEVQEGATVVLDLNGHNITVTGDKADAISNHGNLTIKGNGKVSSAAGAVVNYPGGTVTLDDGEYFSSGWYVIKNMGTMVINDMKFTNEVSSGASLIANGFYGNTSIDRNQVPTASTVASLTINGGIFENKNNSCNVVKNDDYGILVINGGTFVANSDSEENGNPVIQNWNKTTINDGSFTSNHGWALANGFSGEGSDIGEMTINGGTFTGDKGLFATNGGAIQGKGILTINDGIFNGDTAISDVYTTLIKGGAFSKEPDADSLDEGLVANQIDEYYYVMENVIFEDEDSPVAIISEKALPLDYKLEVTKIDSEDLKSAETKVEDKFKSDEKVKDTKLLALYDISMKNNDGIVPLKDEKLLVYVQLEKDLLKYDHYKVVYIDENGEIKEVIDAELLSKLLKTGLEEVFGEDFSSEDLLEEIDGDMLVFETSHLSTYGVVGYNDVKVDNNIQNSPTGDNVITYIVMLVVGLFGSIVLIKSLKRKFN